MQYSKVPLNLSIGLRMTLISGKHKTNKLFLSPAMLFCTCALFPPHTQIHIMPALLLMHS